MHGVMHLQTYVTFLTLRVKRRHCATSAIFREIRMNSDCNISKQSLKVSKGKQPRKNKSWPTGREFKGLSLVSCSNAYKKKMGVTDTTQCTVVTNDTE
jgi:hypothetical protein